MKVARTTCALLGAAAISCAVSSRANDASRTVIAPAAPAARSAEPAVPKTPSADEQKANPALDALVPVPFWRLPHSLLSIDLDVEPLGRRRLLAAICGYRDPEGALLDGNIHNAKSAGPVLKRPDEGRQILLCRSAVARALTASIAVSSITFSQDNSVERLSFVELPFDRLPPTASYGRDGAAVSDLPQARCISSFESPEQKCADLSDVIAKWPDGKWWVFGRPRGLRAMLDAVKIASAPHPKAALFNELAALAGKFPITQLEDEEPKAHPAKNMLGHVSARDGDAWVRIYLSVDEGAASRKEAELSAASAEVLARTKKPIFEYVTRRSGRVVTERSREVDGADRMDNEARQSKRAAILAPILDAWMNGKAPKPEDFASLNGHAYVNELRANMR